MFRQFTYILHKKTYLYIVYVPHTGDTHIEGGGMSLANITGVVAQHVGQTAYHRFCGVRNVSPETGDNNIMYYYIYNYIIKYIIIYAYEYMCVCILMHCVYLFTIHMTM